MPAVTAAQMQEVDRIMTEDLGISLLKMMENAGRALAELTRIHLAGTRSGGRRLSGGCTTELARIWIGLSRADVMGST
jgi:NAD(P)H-hydrate repair Nnr-like enzyme with NAD(P)H-hydrate epimerase domain